MIELTLTKGQLFATTHHRGGSVRTEPLPESPTEAMTYLRAMLVEQDRKGETKTFADRGLAQAKAEALTTPAYNPGVLPQILPPQGKARPQRKPTLVYHETHKWTLEELGL